MANYEKRILQGGFVQHRRIGPRGGKGRWEFYITGFSGPNDESATLLGEPANIRVPIDQKGRILVNGKWYGRAHWDH